MVYLIIGNPAETGVARVFEGETALECAKKALAVLPQVAVKNGVFAGTLARDKADAKAWALIAGLI